MTQNYFKKNHKYYRRVVLYDVRTGYDKQDRNCFFASKSVLQYDCTSFAAKGGENESTIVNRPLQSVNTNDRSAHVQASLFKSSALVSSIVPEKCVLQYEQHVLVAGVVRLGEYEDCVIMYLLNLKVKYEKNFSFSHPGLQKTYQFSTIIFGGWGLAFIAIH